MPIGVLGASLIGGGIQALGNIWSNQQNKKNAASQRDWQQRQNTVAYDRQRNDREYQNQYDLDQWHRNNEYNSPQQQMARMKAAGLNPRLMYGQGTVGNSSGPPKSSAANATETRGYSRAQAMSVTRGTNVMQDMYQFKNIAAQTDNTLAATDAIKTKMVGENTLNLIKAENLISSRRTNFQGAANLYDSIDAMRLKNSEMAQKIRALGVDTDFKKDTYTSRLKSQGYREIGLQWDNSIKKQTEVNLRELQHNINAKTNLTWSQRTKVKAEAKNIDSKTVFQKIQNKQAIQGINSSDNVALRRMAQRNPTHISAMIVLLQAGVAFKNAAQIVGINKVAKGLNRKPYNPQINKPYGKIPPNYNF